jgi:hypothetical protein
MYLRLWSRGRHLHFGCRHVCVYGPTTRPHQCRVTLAPTFQTTHGPLPAFRSAEKGQRSSGWLAPIHVVSRPAASPLVFALQPLLKANPWNCSKTPKERSIGILLEDVAERYARGSVARAMQGSRSGPDSSPGTPPTGTNSPSSKPPDRRQAERKPQRPLHPKHPQPATNSISGSPPTGRRWRSVTMAGFGWSTLTSPPRTGSPGMHVGKPETGQPSAPVT